MRAVFFSIILFFLFSCRMQPAKSTKTSSIKVEEDFSQAIEFPFIADDEKIISHFAYSLSYNEQHEQASWIAYQLKASEIERNFKRNDKFIEDPLIETQSANKSDYKSSGYDRGHLAPAADMTWNETAMIESFYFSNMSPQLPGFNRGIWKKLEENVRDWAVKYDSIYITTGPVFKQTDSVIGANRVTIPTHFYKSILIYNDSLKQSIGFLLPHE